MRRYVPLLFSLLVAVTVAACGDDDGAGAPNRPDPAPASEEPAPDERPDGADADAAEASDPTSRPVGTATVDGTVHPLDRAVRCDAGGEVEARFLGGEGDDAVRLDIAVGSRGGSSTVEVTWTGPEGELSTTVTETGGSWTSARDELYQDAPVAGDDDRVSGTVVLHGATGEEVDVDFDLTLPVTTETCD
jgi:hypothetical protein